MIRNKGFTLIELMIVIAILGILLAIAIPAYQDYTIRTRVSECFNLQAPVKLQISEYYMSNASMPVAADVSVSRTTTYCGRSVYARGNAHVAQLDVEIDEAGVGRAAADVIAGVMWGVGCAENGDVAWACGRRAADGFQGRFLPASCRTAINDAAAARAHVQTGGGVCSAP